MTKGPATELRCSRELGLRLGAIEPNTIENHKRLRASGLCLLLRDPVTLLPMFWPLIDSREGSSTAVIDH